jgi:hypothetical protein
MANMSYCRFENTYNDMLACVGALEQGDYPQSNDEKEAAKYIVNLCNRYIRAYENMELDLER